MMNIKKIVSLLKFGLVSILFHSNANAVYLVVDDGDSINTEAMLDTKSCHFPDVCRINTIRGSGTGILISNNLVLTAAHVVGDKEENNSNHKVMDSNCVFVALQDELCLVEKVIIYSNSLDIALVKLSKPLDNKSMIYRKIQETTSETHPLINTVSVQGYGSGRIIHKTKVSDYDIIEHFLDPSFSQVLRFKKFNVTEKIEKKNKTVHPLVYKPNGYVTLPQFTLNSENVKCGSGDSGSPLIAYQKDSTENAIIGILTTGVTTFLRDEQSLLKDIRQQYEFEISKIYEKLPWYTNLTIGIIGHIDSDYLFETFINPVLENYKFKIFTDIYTEKSLVHNKKVFNALEGAVFVSHFCGFNKKFVDWVNQTIQQEAVKE